MKIFAYILLGIIAIPCLLVFVCLIYLRTTDWNPFEGGWYKDQTAIVVSDGYTYFLMHENGLMQDPGTRLVRTKNVDDEESFEILGNVCVYNAQLPVIWPSNIEKPVNNNIFYMQTSNVILTMNRNEVAFVFDINKQKFYDHYGDIDVPPFVLMSNESVLPESEVIELIFHVIDDYRGHLESQDYLRNHMSDQSITLEYEPRWPKPMDLKEGLTHPNEDVQRLSRWLLEIQENGFSQRTETINELIEYLRSNETSKNSKICECLNKIYEYTGWNDE